LRYQESKQQTPKAFENLSGLTPKAFANSSPGLERIDNPGITKEKCAQTLKGFANCRTLSGLIAKCREYNPRFSLRSNPGLKLANAFGVNVVRLSNAFGINTEPS